MEIEVNAYILISEHEQHLTMGLRRIKVCVSIDVRDC
jgi:hypothetical protein